MDERSVHAAESVLVDFAALFAGQPTAYLVMSADLMIVEVNASYLQLLGRTRGELVGRPVFEAFPPEPASLDAQGRNPVQLSFERVRDTGRTDVTDYMRDREGERRRGREWRRRAELVEADLYVRAQELRAALQSQETSSRRLAALAEVALQLAAAESVTELVEKVVGAGLTALGADGGVLAVRDDSRAVVRLMFTDSLGAQTQQEYSEVPLASDLPASWAARTGELVALPDRQAGLAWSAAMAGLYEVTSKQAWAALPLRVGDQLLGSLTASWAEPHEFAPDEIALLSAFAAQCAQALGRLQLRDVEQQAAVAARQMSEALQHSMLTDPPQIDHLEIAVRYRPAAAQVQVGGDWYDAFINDAGGTCLVVGDVTGHDRQAAAVMGQIRNLLRGLAHALVDPPGLVMSAVDKAMHDLQMGSMATAVLAIVEQTAQQRSAGLQTLRWTNAGHMPPLLIEPDGASRLLVSDPDLLLGVDPATERADHSIDLQPGSMVVLYTDGLVERRGVSIDQGLTWLLAATEGRADLTPDQLCDVLLEAVGATVEDDIALLVFRAHPEDQARPPLARPL